MSSNANAWLGQPMRPGLATAGCSIISRPVGNTALSIGAYIDSLVSRFGNIPPLVAAPIIATNAQATSSYGLAAGATAADLSAIVRATLAAGDWDTPPLHFLGVFFAQRFTNNAAQGPFTINMTPITRNIVTNTILATPNAQQSYTVSPLGGANSATSGVLFNIQASRYMTHNGTSYVSSSLQNQYTPNSRRIIADFGTDASAALAAVGNAFFTEPVNDAVVLTIEGGNSVSQSSSFTPIFGNASTAQMLMELFSLGLV